MADTGRGAVLELQLPALTLLRTMKLFTAKDHINTLAMWPPGSPGSTTGAADASTPALWAVLHGLGRSSLAQIDLASGTVARRIRHVGDKCHGLSLWRGQAIMLSSGEGRLVSIDLEAAARSGDAYEPEVLWEDPDRTFMKGLTGESRPRRPHARRPHVCIWRMRSLALTHAPAVIPPGALQ